MKYALSLAAVLAIATAQSVTDIPSCALQCVANGVTGVGCELTDFKCSCGKADQLTPAVTPCVQQACSDVADQQKVVTTLEGICAAAGVPITVPEPGASSAPAEESSAAPTVETSGTLPAQDYSKHKLTAFPVPAPSLTDIVVTSPTGYPVAPTKAPEESCVSGTLTVTETVTKPSAPSMPSVPPAPYPTPIGTGAPSVPAPSGTGGYTPTPPEFTGAAAAVKLPGGIAGVLGLVAFML